MFLAISRPPAVDTPALWLHHLHLEEGDITHIQSEVAGVNGLLRISADPQHSGNSIAFQPVSGNSVKELFSRPTFLQEAKPEDEVVS